MTFIERFQSTLGLMDAIDFSCGLNVNLGAILIPNNI